MRQSRRRESRRGDRQEPRRSVSTQDRAGFIADMFREYPERSFTLKQITTASGDASRESRYAVRDIVEALERDGIVERRGRDKYQLSTSQLPRYEGVVDMLASGAAYVKVEELENDIYVSHHNTGHALDGDRVEVALQRQGRDGGHPEGTITKVIERSGKRYVGVAEVSRQAVFVHPDSRKLPMDIYSQGLPGRQRRRQGGIPHIGVA